MSVFGVSETKTNAATYSLTCDIKFAHPGVIDIEQLSFVSRQHVVAYPVGGLTLVYSPQRWRNGNGASLFSLREGGGTLEIVVEYGMMLHVQYPAPIVASSTASGGGPASLVRNNGNGLVPVAVQHPSLYSASVILDNAGKDELTG